MHTNTHLPVLFLFAVLLFAPAGFAQDTDNPEARAEWMQGYQKFEAGQKAENHKQYDDAHQLYTEALSVYTQVRAKYPNWNPFILDYRIKFCKKKLAELSTKVKIEKKELDTQDVVNINATLQHRLEAAESKSQELEAQVARLNQAVEKARQEAARGSASAELAENLTWENSKLKKEVATLKRQQTEMAEQLTLHPKDDKAIEDLRRQLEATREQERKYREARQELLQERNELVENNKELSVERAQLLVQLKERQATESQENEKAAQQSRLLAATRQENERLATELKQQQAALATRAKTIDDLQGTLKELQAKDQDTAKIQALYVAAQQANAELREAFGAQQARSETLEGQLKQSKADLDALQIANAKMRKNLDDIQQDQAQLTATIAEGKGLPERLAALREERDEALRKYEAQKELNRVLSAGRTEQPAPLQPDDLKAALTRANQAEQKLEQQNQLIVDLREELAAVQKNEAQPSQEQLQANQKLKADLADARQATANLQETNANLQKENATLQAQLKQAAAGQQPTVQQADIAQLKERVDNLLKARQDLQQEVKAYEAKMSSLDKKLSGQDARLQAAEADARATLATKQALTNSQQALEQKDKVIARLQEQITELRKLSDAQKELLTQRENRQQELTAKVDNLQTELENVRQESKVEQSMLTRQLQKALEKLELNQERTAESTPAASAETPDITSEQADEIDRQLREALAAERQGNTEAATWLYEQVLEKDPDQHRALARLGNIHTDAGNYEQAERYLMQAFYQNPDDKDVLLPLGFILVRMEKGDLAISMLSRAVALYPENADFHRYLGVACRSLGWNGAALVQFNRSFDLDNESSDTAFNLAILHATMDPPDMELARKWYEKAKDLGAQVDPGLERLFKESH